MKDLFKAIMDAYNSGGTDFVTLRAANTEGLHTEDYGQSLSRPYIVMHHLGMTPEFIMGGREIKNSTLQFEIYTDSFSELTDMVEYFTDAFDDLELTYDNDSPVVMQRVEEGPIVKEKNYWSTTLDYEVMRESIVTGGYISLNLYNLMQI